MMEPSFSTRRIAAAAARLSVALVSTSLVTACGGGDDAAPAAAPSRILTTATEPRFTSESVQVLARVGAAWADVSAAATQAPAAARPKADALAAPDAMAQAQAFQQSLLENCLFGGTQTRSFNYASKDAAKIGDYSSTAFVDCRVDDHTILNGLTTSTLVALADNLETWELAATDFAARTDDTLWRENGTWRIATETPAAPATGQKLSVSLDARSFFHSKGGVRLADYTVSGAATADVDVSAQSYAAAVALKLSGDLKDVGPVSWTIETTARLQGSTGAARPTGGTVKLTLADGSTVTLTPGPAGVHVVADFNKDGKADLDVNRTWAQVAAGL